MDARWFTLLRWALELLNLLHRALEHLLMHWALEHQHLCWSLELLNLLLRRALELLNLLHGPLTHQLLYTCTKPWKINFCAGLWY